MLGPTVNSFCAGIFWPWRPLKTSFDVKMSAWRAHVAAVRFGVRFNLVDASIGGQFRSRNCVTAWGLGLILPHFEDNL